jgi:hypothetical protein
MIDSPDVPSGAESRILKPVPLAEVLQEPIKTICFTRKEAVSMTKDYPDPEVSYGPVIDKAPRKYRDFDPAFLAMVKPGSYVKLMVGVKGFGATHAEGLWVKVIKVGSRKPRLYRGLVANHPGRTGLHGLGFKALLDFSADHILSFNISG